MTESAEALWYVAPGRAEIRSVALPPMGPGLAELRVTHSAISRGTERLVLEGRVPANEHERMRAPLQEGAFPFPVKYGYAAAGVVTDGPEALVGRHVFALHPHQTRARVPVEMLRPLPGDVPPARAVLGANAETALNAIWDGAPRPGSRVLVVGAGLLGCLIAAFLARRADLSVTVVDVIRDRARLLSDFGVTFASPEELAPLHDVAFHTTATAAGLQTALDALAFEGRVVELSWFGDRSAAIALGGRFHSQRLAIVSSQVGEVAPARRASTTRAERLSEALGLLADPRLEALVTTEIPFADLPAALPDLLAPGAEGIATRIVYP